MRPNKLSLNIKDEFNSKFWNYFIYQSVKTVRLNDRKALLSLEKSKEGKTKLIKKRVEYDADPNTIIPISEKEINHSCATLRYKT